jgi:hypothetical protein
MWRSQIITSIVSKVVLVQTISTIEKLLQQDFARLRMGLHFFKKINVFLWNEIPAIQLFMCSTKLAREPQISIVYNLNLEI